jgi:hypothetical protein
MTVATYKYYVALVDLKGDGNFGWCKGFEMLALRKDSPLRFAEGEPNKLSQERGGELRVNGSTRLMELYNVAHHFESSEFICEVTMIYT